MTPSTAAAVAVLSTGKRLGRSSFVSCRPTAAIQSGAASTAAIEVQGALVRSSLLLPSVSSASRHGESQPSSTERGRQFRSFVSTTNIARSSAALTFPLQSKERNGARRRLVV